MGTPHGVPLPVRSGLATFVHCHPCRSVSEGAPLRVGGKWVRPCPGAGSGAAAESDPSEGAEPPTQEAVRVCGASPRPSDLGADASWASLVRERRGGGCRVSSARARWLTSPSRAGTVSQSFSSCAGASRHTAVAQGQSQVERWPGCGRRLSPRDPGQVLVLLLTVGPCAASSEPQCLSLK